MCSSAISPCLHQPGWGLISWWGRWNRGKLTCMLSTLDLLQLHNMVSICYLDSWVGNFAYGSFHCPVVFRWKVVIHPIIHQDVAMLHRIEEKHKSQAAFLHHAHLVIYFFFLLLYSCQKLPSKCWASLLLCFSLTSVSFFHGIYTRMTQIADVDGKEWSRKIDCLYKTTRISNIVA